jgi:hypothetical protein
MKWKKAVASGITFLSERNSARKERQPYCRTVYTGKLRIPSPTTTRDPGPSCRGIVVCGGKRKVFKVQLVAEREKAPGCLGGEKPGAVGLRQRPGRTELRRTGG